MLQLLRLLLYLAAGAVLFVPSEQSTYFESAPSCGYAATEFVHFEQNTELTNGTSLGVCRWGFDGLSNTLGPQGYTLVPEPVWQLAPKQECQLQDCWSNDRSCSNGIVESTAFCPDETRTVNCCPLKRYVRCCKSLDCISRSSPAGQCVDGEKDLLPGQQVYALLFAVQAASNDCSIYQYYATRICRADRTFAPAYASCETRAVSRDAEGCVKLPGYVFHPGIRLPDSDAHNWRIDDETPWNRLEDATAAQQAAAGDMLLMASRCSALETCAGFQNTGASTDLFYLLPTRDNMTTVDHAAPVTRCHGIYEKSPTQRRCPRISGYLFIPQRTIDAAVSSAFAPANSSGPCSTCSNSSALARKCTVDNDCVGFSNYHGLIIHSAANPDLLSDAPMTQFAMTPCVGMFVRTNSAFPPEVEQLDRLLCGELMYCTTTQLRYHASAPSSTSGYVDLEVDVFSDLSFPRGLLDATDGSLGSLPTVRSLTFRCHNESMLLGGLPAGLVALTPFLQELRMQGCRITGRLPAQLSQLRYLRVLDLSENALAGSLPSAWSSMTLGYLNLSHNALTGTLPTSWRGVITPQVVAAPPPPAATAAAPPPITNRSSAAQATEAGATGPLSQSVLLVADLSANDLEGPVDRGFVYDSCVRKELRMQLQGASRGLLPTVADLPTFLLHDNPGIKDWAGRYFVADVRGSSGSSNLCGAYGYKIVLGVLWSVFGMCFLAISSWWACKAWKASRDARRGPFYAADMGGLAPGNAPALASAGAGGIEGASETAPGSRGIVATRNVAVRTAAWASMYVAATRDVAARITGVASELWRKRWVRRVTLLARVGYLAADVALDIRVIVWLFNDGDGSYAAVCLAFLVATQAVISAAVVASMSHHLFSSRLVVALLSPLLVVLGPVLGPVLALANIRSSDVPLVFWRYLELVEFCVALLQAPAESVTQSVVYARLNQLGNGMYMDHGLFLASIILSLGDMLIAAVKLCRYKRGPFRRILVALTHLDRVRDPVDYQKPLLSSDYGSHAGSGAVDYVSNYLDAPLNPSAGAEGRRSPTASQTQMPRTDAGPLPVSPPGAGVANNDGETSAAVLEPSPREQLSPVDEGYAATAAAAHTFTPLTAPRYRPSMLAASSQRLGGGAHSIGVPSRLGPLGATRSGALTASMQAPLRPPSHTHLPVALAAAARAAGEQPEASSSASARSLVPAGAEAAMLGAGMSDAAAGTADRSLTRRSRSLQTAIPAQSLTSQNAPMGLFSSDVHGSAATGGHGPPPLGITTSAPVQEVQGMAGPASCSGAAATAQGQPTAATAATATGAAAIAALPPPSPSSDPSYMPSAAAAARAALADSMPGPLPSAALPSGPSVAAPPERLTLGPPFRSTSISGSGEGPGASPGARSLHHVSSLATSSRSAQASPARRREGPVLSIAVPASPVHAQGIEVIRMTTPSSARRLSPQTSRGAPTPVGMLPPPPQHLQMLLQQERRGRQQQEQQERSQQQQQTAQQQEPNGCREEIPYAHTPPPAPEPLGSAALVARSRGLGEVVAAYICLQKARPVTLRMAGIPGGSDSGHTLRRLRAVQVRPRCRRKSALKEFAQDSQDVQTAQHAANAIGGDHQCPRKRLWFQSQHLVTATQPQDAALGQ
ncbi:hypothetical protein VOLCADRAFT_90760 [Volvox carteri f. nagariensis]|uniref:Chitin-binding type-2 domain-containing protein n=1 Tax=Volvox carteri f. nagariensis TaxID=3068 RepID=D8TVN6_VOLCA|nr:uncharacterized protein VOLCADRAFT_90760 [Volvox carteri f. nagariensis]EFJ48485.1 hypothetical protein VOLCADRAFT_90760 [Volvox carteri f. nagariensis]|eukprot:XP_002950284.1 hypothetical protein VOLCADRAFT_90760 [Volvox carteri f. nagariensis]